MNKKLMLVSLMPFSLFLFSCNKIDLNLANTKKNESASGDGLVSLHYLNSRQSNNLIFLENGSSFPDLSTIVGINAGSFFQERYYEDGNGQLQHADCEGSALIFAFSIQNIGTEALKASQDPAVSFLDLTVYNFGTDPSTYEIVNPPSFPIAPGASTIFSVRVTNPTGCRYQEQADGAYDTKHVFNMKIHTDDAVNPDYGVDLTILGSS